MPSQALSSQERAEVLEALHGKFHEVFESCSRSPAPNGRLGYSTHRVRHKTASHECPSFECKRQPAHSEKPHISFYHVRYSS
jgi:hypothetical protein